MSPPPPPLLKSPLGPDRSVSNRFFQSVICLSKSIHSVLIKNKRLLVAIKRLMFEKTFIKKILVFSLKVFLIANLKEIIPKIKRNKGEKQCSGSAYVGSECFWAYRFRILPLSSKKLL
jgi:hypothetical protein